MVRPTTAEDQPQLTEFLTRVFAMAPDAPFVEPALMRWKYWTPRLDCPEPRSLVMDRDGRIVAHVGLWPVNVGNERGVQMIDWASDPQVPGGGVSLLQRLTKTYDFVYSIGGSDKTLAILPRFGFKCIAEARTWARPIRPLRQLIHHPARNVRLPLRFARNFWWSHAPARAIPRGWSYVPSPGAATTERDSSFFQYLKQCPVARCLTFDIKNDGRKAGSFAICEVWEQARLAGVWLDVPSPDNWRAAFHLVQAAALKHTKTSELVARCASGPSAEAAGPAGMRLRSKAPVLLFRRDPQARELPLQFQLCDDDGAFLGGRLDGFLT